MLHHIVIISHPILLEILGEDGKPMGKQGYRHWRNVVRD